MVYAIDFDGTLSMGTWPEVGPANTELFDFLKEKQRNGDKLILWTCRAGEPLEKAVDFCREHGLIFDAINDNLPETIEDALNIARAAHSRDFSHELAADRSILN